MSLAHGDASQVANPASHPASGPGRGLLAAPHRVILYAATAPIWKCSTRPACVFRTRGPSNPGPSISKSDCPRLRQGRPRAHHPIGSHAIDAASETSAGSATSSPNSRAGRCSLRSGPAAPWTAPISGGWSIAYTPGSRDSDGRRPAHAATLLPRAICSKAGDLARPGTLVTPTSPQRKSTRMWTAPTESIHQKFHPRSETAVGSAMRTSLQSWGPNVFAREGTPTSRPRVPPSPASDGLPSKRLDQRSARNDFRQKLRIPGIARSINHKNRDAAALESRQVFSDLRR